MKLRTKYEPSMSDILWTINHLAQFETGQHWMTDDYAVLIDVENNLLKVVKGAETKSERENLARLEKNLKNTDWKIVKGTEAEIESMKNYKADWGIIDLNGMSYFGQNEEE